MMTARDPYVNMLRTTAAVTAAGVAGADSVTALPFTLALGLPDRLARRVARNMQLILLEELNLYRVSDPAAGAGGIEHLTTEMAKSAWALFQEIEAAGGMAAALEQGLFQKKVAETLSQRQAAIAKRKDALTGTSDYPNLAEAPVKVLDVPRVAAPTQPATFEALPSLRLAEPFEALARQIRRHPCQDRIAPKSVPRQSRQALRVQRPRHLRPQLLRSRRYRSGDQ